MTSITKMAGFLMLGLATSLPVQAEERACAALKAAGVDEMRIHFVCAQDALTQAFLNSPAVVFAYVFGVLLVMFLVQRAARPARQKSAQSKAEKRPGK